MPPEEFAWSPYSGLDALCGNVLLVSLDGLARDGLLDKQDLPQPIPVGKADFPKVLPHACHLDAALRAPAPSRPALGCLALSACCGGGTCRAAPLQSRAPACSTQLEV